jgi:hypothetical protein
VIGRLSDLVAAKSTSGLMFAVPKTARWCESVIKTATKANRRSKHENHLFRARDERARRQARRRRDSAPGVAAMHKMRLRYYLYIAAGVAALISTLTDPDMHAASSIAALFQSLAALSRDVFSALR